MATKQLTKEQKDLAERSLRKMEVFHILYNSKASAEERALAIKYIDDFKAKKYRRFEDVPATTGK